MKKMFSLLSKYPLVAMVLLIGIISIAFAFNAPEKLERKAWTTSELLQTEEGVSVLKTIEWEEDEFGDAMSSSIVYSFTADSLVNTDAVTFTVPDVLKSSYDVLVQGARTETTNGATVICSTKISAGTAITTFITEVQADTLADSGTFLVNENYPEVVKIPRTTGRVTCTCSQTGTGAGLMDMEVRVKRFPN